ncbi:MAG: hypothetical protein AAGC60_03055 [Acidobacteriota bacterium]
MNLCSLSKRFLLIASCTLLIAPLALAAEPGLRSATGNAGSTSTPEVTLDTLWARFGAVAPLIGAEDPAQAVADRSAELGVSTGELDFWRKLLLNHGRQGLLAVTDADAKNMANLQVGSWQLIDRSVNGKSEATNNWMFNEVVALSSTGSRIRSLMMEASTAPDGTAINIGTFGTINQSTIVGPSNGLPIGQSGVMQSASFQLIGMNCPPGMAIPVSIETTALWVRQGDVLRTVEFNAEYFDSSGNLIPEMSMGSVAMEAASELQISSYTGIGMEETQARMSDKVLLDEPMTEIWRQAQTDSSVLDPSKWMSGGPTQTPTMPFLKGASAP